MLGKKLYYEYLVVIVLLFAGCTYLVRDKTVQNDVYMGERVGVEGMEKATFAAGCFWHVEEAFRTQEGVISTQVGYTGGNFDNPSYEQVCTGKTGHAEAVEVVYDPERISYEDLLRVFFENHNPTTFNRQGPDKGSQYRSAVFYHTELQKGAVLAFKERLEKSGTFGKPIVTEIMPAATFYRAEEYHQKYYRKKRGAACYI